jgi:hypothetical protein
MPFRKAQPAHLDEKASQGLSDACGEAFPIDVDAQSPERNIYSAVT